LVDEERAPIVKEIFKKVANEFWTGREIYLWLKNELDFKTRGGKHVALSGIYRMLDSTFYYGEFEFPKNSGNWYKGEHEPLISKELFKRARGNLIFAPRQYGLKEFQFTKLITCGSCGSGITASEKIKRKLNGEVKRHVYYYCCNKMPGNCKPTYIREENLLEQIIKLMDKIDFDKEGISKKIQEELEKYNKFSRSISATINKLDKNKISPEIINVRTYAKYILNEGPIQEKRDLLINLKSKLVLRDNKIFIK
jgi:hypothetical protein